MPSDPAAYDAVVIGAGSGGLTVAIGLAGFGKRVALVERGPVGGDCTNVGCVPSKRLIHLCRRAGADGAEALADVRAMRDALSRRERHELEEHPGIDLVTGSARLAGPGAVDVDGRRLTAGHVVIATGSRAGVPSIPGLPAERLLTNATLFELERVPAHLAIVGAGAIGLEMGAAFRRLGARVTIVEAADRVLPQAIPEASEALAAALAEGGIAVHTGVRDLAYLEEGRILQAVRGGEALAVPDVDAVLVAAGRIPNTEDLGLETVGITAGPAGIPVDGWGRTGARGVWAVGDVTPGSRQTHAANAMGRRIVQRIALPRVPALGGPPVIPSAVFSEPEVAWVGLTAQELERRCHPGALIRIRVDLADTDRGLTDGVRHGFLVVHAVRLTGRIVSATAVGPNASELVGFLTLAISRRVSLLRLSRLVYAYPTHSGVIGKVADEFSRRTLGNLRGEAVAYARHRFARRPRS